MELKRFDRAAEEFRRIFEAEPQAAFAAVNWGIALFRAHDYEKAVAPFREALNIGPRDARAHYYLARTYSKIKKHELAVRHLKEAISLAPADSVLRYRLAGVYLEQGRADDAREEYGRVITIDPGHIQAHYRLGKLLIRDGERARGRKLLSEHLRLQRAEVENGAQRYGRKAASSAYDEMDSPDFGPPGRRAEGGSWLEVRLDGRKRADSLVTIWAGRLSVEAKLGPTAKRFDMGGRARADVVKVAWPDGTSDIRFNVHSGQTIVIRKTRKRRVGHRF